MAAIALTRAVVLLDITPDTDGFAGRAGAPARQPPAVALISSRDASAYRRRLADTPARASLPRAS